MTTDKLNRLLIDLPNSKYDIPIRKLSSQLNKKILYRQAPLNIDPGVHSSLNLEALARVPTVPNMPGVPPVPTLPTITEAKVADDSQEKKQKVRLYSHHFIKQYFYDL